MATIDEQVHAGQAKILDSGARFRIVACGRRYGKTVTCAKETRDDLFSHGDEWLTWWVAPTYQQAEIGSRALLDELPEKYVADFNQSKLRVETTTGAVCEFKSADQPDNLRGEGVDKLIVDEAPEVSQYAYENALRPTLTDSEHSRMIAIGTPKGRGWFFRLWQRGQSDDWPDYESFRAPTSDNPFINTDDVADAKRTLPDRVFRQEYLAEFISETGGVFENLDETLFTASYSLPDQGLPPLPDDASRRDPDVPYAEKPFSIGVDFARHQDFRVTIVLDANGRLVYFDRGQHEAWPKIQNDIQAVSDRYPGVVSVDASRDNKIVADLEAAGVPINPVKFSSSRKQELIENLAASVEAGELTAPDIPTLRSELEVFEYDVTRAGNVRYHAPQGHHDDTVDTLALAADGLKEATRQAASATASVGGNDGQGPGGELGEVVKNYQQQARRGGNKWK
jgi:hypothetical protein